LDEGAGDFDLEELEAEEEGDFAIELTPFEARWEEFTAEEDYERQIALFLKTLDEGLMDDENAFEMLNTIYDNSVAHGERERWDGLVALLRERLPDVYAHDACFYLEWLIADALVAGRLEELPALADELADTAGKHLDTVIRVFDQLAYHGQTAVLAAAARRAWPLVREGEYFDWAVEEFADRGATYTILDYLERTPAPSVDDLLSLQAAFGCVDSHPDSSARYLAHVTGQAGRQWTLADFDLTMHRQRKGEPPPANEGRRNLHYLTVEFLGHLHREEGVSYSKGELGRAQIVKYILERHAGELMEEPDEDEDYDRDPFSRRRKSRRRPPRPEHLLCPDRGTLDRFLVNLLNLFSWQTYKAAAIFELLPAWLRFLESRGLIDPQQHAKTLHELDGMAADMVKVLSNYPSDPALRLAAERWRENAGLS
jgi:hypothetical protein